MAQLNDLLVMGQSTLLGPVKIDSIIDKNGSNGATNSSTIDKVLKSDDNGKVYWGSADNVTFSQTLTSGTKIGTITINGTGTDLYCQTNTNTTYTFTGGTNKFTVTPSGGSAQTVTITPSITNNITGTGTSGYIAKFNDTNTIESSGYKLFTYSSTSPDCWGVIPYIDANGYTKIGKYIQFHTSDTATSAACTITGDSSYIYLSKQVQAPSFYATSDARLKTNIQPHTYNISKSILDLPIYKFDFIEGSKNQIGCLAQDLQKICPEIVAVDKNGFLSIQESKITYLLINEIKKLKNRIELLEEQRRVD